jgi:hypothetical protein
VVLGLPQPALLARLLASHPARGLGTVFLPVAQAGVAAKQLLATQASTSSGFDHGAFGSNWGPNHATHKMPPADVAQAYAMMPIAVLTLIDAGTASSSPFQRTPKYVHDHAGIVFTFRWNMRSRCAGNRDHERPEYASWNISAMASVKIPVSPQVGPVGLKLTSDWQMQRKMPQGHHLAISRRCTE